MIRWAQHITTSISVVPRSTDHYLVICEHEYALYISQNAVRIAKNSAAICKPNDVHHVYLTYTLPVRCWLQYH